MTVRRRSNGRAARAVMYLTTVCIAMVVFAACYVINTMCDAFPSMLKSPIALMAAVIFAAFVLIVLVAIAAR